jgi:hypothetical protein
MSDALPIALFEERTGIPAEQVAAGTGATSIVSMRAVARIVSVQAMPLPYLERLIRSVPLVGDRAARPYAECRIDRYRHDPRMSKIGQTFVERRKIDALHESFNDAFEGHDVPSGIAKKGAYVVRGIDASGTAVVAHYLPPIVEQIGNKHAVLDGIHCFSYVKGAGTTIEIIKISDPAAPFPCELRTWKRIRVADAKPPKEERFFGLKPELFRDLKHVGIDG